MKKSIFTIALCLPLLAIAQQNGTYTLTGTVKNAGPNAKVYAKYSNWGKPTVDSSLVKNGIFELKNTLPSPTRVTLIYDSKGLGLTKLGKETDQREIYLHDETAKIQIKDSIKTASITGSALNAEHERYLKAMAPANKRIASLDAEWKNTPEEQRKDPAALKTASAKYEALKLERIDLMEKYIIKNPDSYFSLTSVRDASGSVDATRFEKLFGYLSAERKASGLGLAVAKLLADAKATAIGSLAPDFTQFDPNGKPVKLSDFRGKYVLIDFWASWCGPCRAENPHVVKAYNKYKDKNFTILGVSLDFQGQKTAWLNAVKADQLEWPQVSDLKGFKNEAAQLYFVKGIPQNFLISPEGKIVAQNLRGQKLDDTLAEILGKS